MAGAFTSVPRQTPVSEMPNAPEYLIVSFTEQGRAAAEQAWPLDGTAAGRHHIHRPSAGPDVVIELRKQARQARVGLRVLIAGPEADVFAASSALKEAGMVDEEISPLITDTGLRRVYCTHCRATTTTRSQIGQTVVCGNCTRELLVYYHFSRRTASYLGFQVDAEEVP